MILQKLSRILSTAFSPTDDVANLIKPVLLSDLLDSWQSYMISEGNLALGSINNYLSVIRTLKTIPISQFPLSDISMRDLQDFFDSLSTGYHRIDGSFVAGYSRSHILAFSAVLQGAFKYAVYPGEYLSKNPMTQVVLKRKNDERDLFQVERLRESYCKTLTDQQYRSLVDFLRVQNNPALLPVEIAYYTGLRLGEVCGLAWDDINLQEQYMEIRRAVILNRMENRLEFTATKRNKIRVVYFGKALKEILVEAKMKQEKDAKLMGKDYFGNYYEQIPVDGHFHYPLYSIRKADDVPDDFHRINLVCLRPDGSYESRRTVSNVCIRIKNQLPGMEHFHFHMLRHTYTSRLLSAGAQPKHVQELLGHSDISTTMNVYAHAEKDELKKIVEKI